jgi:predicted permease
MERAPATTWPRIIGDHVVSASRELASVALRDCRFAWRGMRRQPGFSLIVIASIALGIGVNAAIFSVVYGVMLRPLPYSDAGQLVVVSHEPTTWLTSQAEYFDYEREVPAFTALAAHTTAEGNLTAEGGAERVALASVTRNFFEVMGRGPAIGRVFADDEDRSRPATVAIISHGLWQRHFGGDSGVVGKTLEVNGVQRTVIGVMPRHFDFPNSNIDLWLPMLRFDPGELQRTNHYLFVVGRLAPGATLPLAATQARVAAQRMMQNHPESYDPRDPLTPVLTGFREHVFGPARQYLWALMGAVVFVLLIVCVNVANLLLSRGEARRMEMAVRTALGASRTRLASQLLAESFLYAGIGGACGLAIAWGGTRMLVALAPGTLPRLDEIRLDWPIVAYAAVMSLVAGVIFGVSPALRAMREAPVTTLRVGKSLQGRRARRMRRTLVVAEVALAVVLLSGAGLLLRSLQNLQDNDLGFDPAQVYTAKVSLLATEYDEGRATQFFSQLRARIASAPGVVAVGASGWLPVVDAGGMWGVLPEGGIAEGAAWPMLVPQQVTPGYFAAIGLRIQAGREFTDADRAGSPLVAIISESAVRHLWPDGGDPLGKRFRVGGLSTPVYMTVIGVAADIRSRGFADTPEPTMYVPFAQTHLSTYVMPRSMSLVIRTSGTPSSIAPAVRAAVNELDPAVAVSRESTLEALVGSSVASRRFTTGLLLAFAALAVLLAGLGIFGVISHGVAERTFEIGVRVAVGASRARVVLLVLRESTRLVLAGVVLGVAGSAAIAQFLRSMLVGVSAIDVPILLAVSAVLLVVALLASTLPAYRALAVDPAKALRA